MREKSIPELSWVEDEELDEVVLHGLLLGAKRTLDVATADVKNLIVPRGEGRGRGRGRGRGGRGHSRDIVDELGRLASSGVRVRLLHSGVPSESFLRRMRETGLHELAGGGRSAAGSFTMRRCIRNHLKMVIADGERLYLGTANLTGAGIGAKSPRRRNFEAGIVTSDPELVERGRGLFSAVWGGVFCDECGRKKYCPVPLEEPEF